MKEDVFPHMGDVLVVIMRVLDWENTDAITDYKFPLTESLAELWGCSWPFYSPFLSRLWIFSSALRCSHLLLLGRSIDCATAWGNGGSAAAPYGNLCHLLSCLVSIRCQFPVIVLQNLVSRQDFPPPRKGYRADGWSKHGCMKTGRKAEAFSWLECMSLSGNTVCPCSFRHKRHEHTLTFGPGRPSPVCPLSPWTPCGPWGPWKIKTKNSNDL